LIYYFLEKAASPNENFQPNEILFDTIASVCVAKHQFIFYPKVPKKTRWMVSLSSLIQKINYWQNN
ncbi:MAG TPA: hypothetical protein PKD85_03970, partial [Saprospiraceae bacterium]|nr:hypothetical protein [Saprospiraceae bacterium]